MALLSVCVFKFIIHYRFGLVAKKSFHFIVSFNDLFTTLWYNAGGTKILNDAKKKTQYESKNLSLYVQKSFFENRNGRAAKSSKVLPLTLT